MQSNLQESETIQPQRPTFLKVLCILTFIGSAYTLVTSAITYANPEAAAKMIKTQQEKMQTELNKNKNGNDNSMLSKVSGSMEAMSSPQNIRNSSLGNIVVSVLCLLGAFLMWKLNKTGFYIYVLGTLIGIIIPFYLYGSNFLTNLTAGAASFVGILFVIFYAMNLKSMRRTVTVS